MALLSYTFGTYTAAAPGGDDDEQNAPTGNPLLDAIRASKNKKLNPTKTKERSTLQTGATGTSSDGAAANPGPQPIQPAAAAGGPPPPPPLPPVSLGAGGNPPPDRAGLFKEINAGGFKLRKPDKSAPKTNATVAPGSFEDVLGKAFGKMTLTGTSAAATANDDDDDWDIPSASEPTNVPTQAPALPGKLKTNNTSAGARTLLPPHIASPTPIAEQKTEEQKAEYERSKKSNAALANAFNTYITKRRAALSDDDDEEDQPYDDKWLDDDDDTPAASASAPKQGALQAASTFKKPATAVTSIGASDFAAAQANPIGKVGTSKPIPGPKPPLPSKRPRKPTPAQQAEFISWVLDFLAGQYQGHLSSIAANIQTDEIAEIVFRFLQNENLSTAPEVIAGIQQEMLNQLTTYIPPVLQPFTAPVAVSAGRVGVPKSDEEVLQDYIYDNMIVATQQLNESSFDEIMDTLQQEAANGTFGALVLDEITVRNAIA